MDFGDGGLVLPELRILFQFRGVAPPIAHEFEGQLTGQRRVGMLRLDGRGGFPGVRPGAGHGAEMAVGGNGINLPAAARRRIRGQQETCSGQCHPGDLPARAGGGVGGMVAGCLAQGCGGVC